MANIKKKIEDLKPGKEYILTVRAKNADLNVKSEYTDTIRFVVPTDNSIPGSITGLELYSGVESVMFVFNFSEDKDISRYEYELYDLNQVESIGGTYQLLPSVSPISTGFNDANVFTVTVDNLQVATPSFDETSGLRQFLGRIRGVDTSGNSGVWTNLVKTDSRTPLIDTQYIRSLTADKIRAGTIQGQTITLAGANSVIKSSTYTEGVSGWKIQGDGTAEFGEASIRGAIEGGTIDIGGNDDTSFHVDATGRMWAGSPYFDTAKFRVDNNGVVRIGNEGATPISLWIDQTGAISIGSTPNVGEFVVSSTGQISVGGNDSTSFHINSDGTVTSGDTIESATPPFRLNNDGSIDIGGQDQSSMHILSSGNVQVGASKSSTLGPWKAITAASANAVDMTFTSANHGFDAGQTISTINITSNPANKFNQINKVIKSVTTNTVTIDNPLIISISSITPSNPSVGNVRYTTSVAHNLSVGQTVVVTGVTSPSGYNGTFSVATIPSSTQFTVANSTTGTAVFTAATARGTSSYTSGGSIRKASPFNITASNGSVRVTDIDITGTISGTGNHLNLGNVLRINDTIAIGSSTIRATNSVWSYDDGLNFSLSASGGFVARTGTVVGITIDDSGYNSILPITGSAIRASSNGSAAAPAYKFAATNYGFYIDPANDLFWSSSGTGYEIWHSGNDGAASGLDADKLDGLDSSQFLRSDATDSSTGNLTAASLIVSSGAFIDNSGDLQVNSMGTVAYWNNSNGGTLGKTTSSIKYKENVKPIELNDLDPKNLLEVNIYQFNYKDEFLSNEDSGRGVIFPGFIVEELVNIYPKAVVNDDEGNPDSWNYNYIIPPMLKLIQDLYKKIEVLEDRLNGN